MDRCTPPSISCWRRTLQFEREEKGTDSELVFNCEFGVCPRSSRLSKAESAMFHDARALQVRKQIGGEG